MGVLSIVRLGRVGSLSSRPSGSQMRGKTSSRTYTDVKLSSSVVLHCAYLLSVRVWT